MVAAGNPVGAVHDTVALLSPAVAITPVGAFSAPTSNGRDWPLAAEVTPEVVPLATTETVYTTPSVRPDVMVQVVRAALPAVELQLPPGGAGGAGGGGVPPPAAGGGQFGTRGPVARGAR